MIGSQTSCQLVSREGLLTQNPSDVIRLAFFLSPDKMQTAFSKLGITVANENDVNALIKITENKLDTSGKLKSKEGNVLVFDTMRIINNIPFSEQEGSKIELIKQNLTNTK